MTGINDAHIVSVNKLCTDCISEQMMHILYQ